MKFLEQYGLILLLVVILTGTIIYFSFFREKNISLDFSINSDLSPILDSINTKMANKGVGLYLNVPLTTMVKNNSKAAVALQNLSGAISYDGNTIMQTNAGSAALQNINVAGKSKTPVTDTVQVLLNPSTIKFFSQLVKGNKPLIKYNFNALVGGKAYTLNNQTTINKLP